MSGVEPSAGRPARIPRARRRYLTGVDWMIGTFDHIAHHTTGASSRSQVVLTCEGVIDATELRRALHLLTDRLPIMHGQPARDWLTLCPYWRVPRRTPKAIDLTVIDAADPAAATTAIEAHVNRPFDRDAEHLRFILVRESAGRSHVGMMFDHRLLDATGSERLLMLVDVAAAGKIDEMVPQIGQSEPADWGQWRKRFASVRRFNDWVFAIAKEPVRALFIPKNEKRIVKYVHASLSAQETIAFDAIAAKEIGMPIVLPSAAARAFAAFDHAVPKPTLEGTQVTMFTSATGRLPGQVWETLLFNRFSMLLFRLPVAIAGDARAGAVAIRDQFFQQMREQIPQAMKDSTAVARLWPHWLNAWLLKFPFKGRLGTLYFACLKEPGFSQTTFLGREVKRVYHTPLAFSPPGVNLCMTTFQGQFQIVLSYVDGLMSDDAAQVMMETFRTSLIASVAAPRSAGG